MKKFLLLWCVLLATHGLYAQQRTVTGKVTDATDGSGLPGASVLVKGTTRGTVTDVSGNYSIQASSEEVLAISFIGFESQEMTVGERTTINASMAPSIATLGEVVVIGYGEREKKDLTGAISSVDSKQIEKSISMTPELAMQGRMTGVFVSSPGGNPNARPTVRIRGVSTFNNAEPLYVIDGVPILEFGTNGSGVEGDVRGNVNVLASINPGDIESISVLKDAASAAIYGARAANGVILITTKKGKTGAPRVEFNGSRGVQNIPSKYDMLNTQEFTEIYQEMFDNDHVYRTTQAPSPDPTAPYIWDIASRNYFNVFNPNSTDPYYKYLGGSPTYNWQDELINKNAVIEDYSVRVSGGTEATNYYVGGGYSRTESPLVQNNLERYSLSTNIQSKISKVFETGVLYRVSYSEALDNTRGSLSGVSIVSPWQPIYDVNDPTGFARTTDIAFEPNPDFDLTKANAGPSQNIVAGTDQLRRWGNESSSNSFAEMALGDTRYTLLKNFGNVYLQAQPLKGLKVKAGFSVDWTYNRRNQWNYNTRSVYFSEVPGNPYNNQNGTSVGTYGERHSRNINLVSDLTVNYNKRFADHNFDVLLNASSQDFKYEFVSASSPQLYAEEKFRAIGGEPRFNSGGTIRDSRALQGYVGRLSYSYKDKYYLDASVRRDGSSDYAEDYRWGTFPGVSAAWRISSEDFFQSAVSIFDDLKIRVGYGELGNTFSQGLGLSNFAYLSSISTSADYSLGSGNGSATGTQVNAAYLRSFPNLLLTWERAKTFNVGLDGAALNNRLTFTAEYYNKNTEGIIQRADPPASAGVNEAVDFNVANVRNSGVELELGFRQKFGELELNFSANLTTVRNRVTAVFNDVPFNRYPGYPARVEVGQPIEFIYGYEVGGIFQNQDEVNRWTETYELANGASPQPGDMWFRDIYGNPTETEKIRSLTPDSLINSNDRTNIGKTIPGFYYGFNIGGRYKGFDLSVFFQGIGDVYKYNGVRAAGESMNGTGLNFWRSTLGRWTPENPSSTMPRAVFGDPADNNRESSRWVENGAFLRLKNVQLGYSLPQSMLDYLKVVSNFRIYFSGTNLFTATKWTGIDPENDLVPPTRVISLGVNATF